MNRCYRWLPIGPLLEYGSDASIHGDAMPRDVCLAGAGAPGLQGSRLRPKMAKSQNAQFR